MNKEIRCWEHASHPQPEPSPFDQVLVLGWYDGPEEGLIRCGRCMRVYHFKFLGFADEEQGIRLLGLAPVPDDSIDRVVQALSPYMSPRWPTWLPLWQFPTEHERQQVDSLIDGILAQAGTTTLVITASNPAETIYQARRVTAQEASRVVDWVSWSQVEPSSAADESLPCGFCGPRLWTRNTRASRRVCGSRRCQINHMEVTKT